ncbi:unnamed protein product [Parajaminaea phylloscopi]
MRQPSPVRSHLGGSPPSPHTLPQSGPDVDTPRKQRRAYSAYSLSSPFSTASARPLLQAGLRELRDVFDLDTPVFVDDEEKDVALGSRGEDGHEHSYTEKQASPSQPGTGRPKPSRQQRTLRGTPQQTARLAFVASSLGWSIACGWVLLQQDLELVSPLLLAPALLPLPISLAALALLLRRLTPRSISALHVLGKLYKSHTMLQGLVAVCVFKILGSTARYDHGRGGEPTPVGSWGSQIAFLAVTLAQAAFPLAIALWAQWKAAGTLERIPQPEPSVCSRASKRVAQSPTLTSPRALASPRALRVSLSSPSESRAPILPVSGPLRTSPEPSCPSSSSERWHASESEGRPADSGQCAITRSSRSFRRTHRSLRPACRESSSNQPPIAGEDGGLPAPQQWQQSHRRAQSQPALPIGHPASGFHSRQSSFGSSGSSGHPVFSEQPLLFRAVQAGMVPPRRCRTHEEDVEPSSAAATPPPLA